MIDLFEEWKPPLAFAAHSFLEISPPQKNKNEERQGERADARYSARGGVQRATTRSERTVWVKATTRSARAKSGVLFEMGSNFLIQ